MRDGETTRARLQPLHWSQAGLLAEADPLVKGVIDYGTMSLLYGGTGSGKTFLALDIAAHVAMGAPWREHKTRQGTVLYIAAEGGHGLRRRLLAYWQHHAIRPEDIPLHVIPDAIDLRSGPGDADLVLRHVDQLAAPDPLVLIVVDTLSRALAGGNENGPEDMGAFVAQCDRLRAATGAHLMAIHHTGKDDGRGARGHSLLRAAVDTEIATTNTGGTVTATIEKQRDGETGEAFAFKLEVVEIGHDPDGDPITSCVPVPTEAPAPAATSGTKLSPNQATMLDLLRDAMPAGLSVADWNDQARAEGIGERRRADLRDIRVALKSKRLIHECGGQWFVTTR